jgi:hypothetical protein
VNLLLLAIAFRAWSGSALSAYLRTTAAIAMFSLEMQLATWAQAGTLGSLRLLNLALASGSILWHARRRARFAAGSDDGANMQPRTSASERTARFPPLSAVAALAVVVAALALLRPIVGADPYHLHRVDHITGRGTLAYDPTALDIKVNALAGVYELLLADLRIPGMATAFVRLHGLLGLGLYLLAIGAVAPWVALRRRWLLLIFLVVPVVFHQLVLVKNDLFGAVPAFVALAWVVIRGRRMTVQEVAAAAALAGVAVGIKISSAPIALLVLAFVWWDHPRDWRAPVAGAVGAGVGAAAGGLVFALIENHRVYGGAMRPYLVLGNRHEHIVDAVVGVGRFTISLFDLGSVTPRVWPGRGGWGTTLGLPLVWALAVLTLRLREPIARRALIAAGVVFLTFAASYPDADLAHRMVIGPGLLLLLVAVGLVDGDDRQTLVMRRVLIVVLIASAAQIARSAVLYLGG